MSKPALKDRAVESRERGTEFLLPLNSVLDRMHKPEERDRFVNFVQFFLHFTLFKINIYENN